MGFGIRSRKRKIKYMGSSITELPIFRKHIIIHQAVFALKASAIFYSVRSAVTGSLLAAFLEGINPPSNVSTTLKRIRTIAGTTGRIALT